MPQLARYFPHELVLRCLKGKQGIRQSAENHHGCLCGDNSEGKEEWG